MNRTPVYCPSCQEYWWSLDDGIVGMTCGLGDTEGAVRRATKAEVEAFYADESSWRLADWSGLV